MMMKMMTIKERVFGKEEVVVGGDQLYSRSLPALRRRGMGGCHLESSAEFVLCRAVQVVLYINL